MRKLVEGVTANVMGYSLYLDGDRTMAHDIYNSSAQHKMLKEIVMQGLGRSEVVAHIVVRHRDETLGDPIDIEITAQELESWLFQGGTLE